MIAYRFNHDIGGLTIRGDETSGRLGVAWTEAAWADGSIDEEVAVIYYAGLAAERLVCPHASPRDGAGSDYLAAARYATTPTRRSELRARAAALVKENSGPIAALATALLRDEALSADETALVIDCIDEGQDWRANLAQLREASKRRGRADA
ncbi:MAG: hypothetical protein JNL08_05855 [Planctomycetes bacterium]|nr:hypothetical protein [Planctomycetota bacterium]